MNIICGLLLDTVESFTLTADQLEIYCIWAWLKLSSTKYIKYKRRITLSRGKAYLYKIWWIFKKRVRRCERQQPLLNVELERVDVNGKWVVTIKSWAVILFVHFRTRCLIYAIDFCNKCFKHITLNMLHFKTWLTQFLMTLLIMTVFAVYSIFTPPTISLGLLVDSDVASTSTLLRHAHGFLM